MCETLLNKKLSVGFMIKRKSPRELKVMQEAGQIVARCHEHVLSVIEPGISTGELDQEVEEMIRDHDAEPAFKDYRGFPASICASINHEIVHGIPSDDRVLEEGDIISVDIGVEHQNYFGDAARTIPVGEVSDKAHTLMVDCFNALDEAIEKIESVSHLHEISKFIQKFGEGRGYEVVRDYVGHGIGREMHEDPQVPNFFDPENHDEGIELKSGMVLALEPMFNCGTYETSTLDNDWTVVTKDGEISAHFEDTVAITDDGIEIYTRMDHNHNSTYHSSLLN